MPQVKHPIILVNDIAASHSGALVILEQFLSEVPKRLPNAHFILLSSIHFPKLPTNVENIVFPQKHALCRMIFDFGGGHFFLRSKKISPNLIVSLQNTGLWTSSSIPQLIYYHQAVPFSSQKWSILKNRSLWFYKKIYPYIVKLSIKNKAHIIVQTNCLKDKITIFLKNKIQSIKVIPPFLEFPSFIKKERDLTKIKAIYPASAYPYKNHKTIINALNIACTQKPEIKSKLQVYFTLTAKELEEIDGKGDSPAKEMIYCLGHLPQKELFEHYSNSDMLLFPSSIESYGLPLLEAQHFGLFIAASNEPFSREVLSNYKNKIHLPALDSNSWASFFQNEIEKTTISSAGQLATNSWDAFSKRIEELC